ncbi:hypothetical protein RHSIM_Rhsim04G0143100 [Rhododendron simsii]|uniref:Uncharacterized protein n=1 Tax=Rhododendron simsii TaxID=118357 RepID=A0A834H378_RHOSS|nr:hypothetical protein RHSIM_Rhsim04G0143800 [Rhododendron simsii]KAF7145883.1 hypothetical protein RHSIM_Rhsim04G0143100 [Rhododendron simsii]
MLLQRKEEKYFINIMLLFLLAFSAATISGGLGSVLVVSAWCFWMKPRTLTLCDQFTFFFLIKDQFSDHEGQPVLDLAGPFPVILGTRMKVNTSNGIKLATRGSSTFCFNPPLPKANALHIWCMGNSSAISKLPIHDMNGQGTPPCCLTPGGKDIIKIN